MKIKKFNQINEKISSSNIDDKIKLLSKFFAKARIVGDLQLDELLELDDLWGEVYEEFRIQKDFYQASLLANEAVIKQVIE